MISVESQEMVERIHDSPAFDENTTYPLEAKSLLSKDETSINSSSRSEWPVIMNDALVIEKKQLVPLKGSILEIQNSVREKKHIKIRSVTWNQQAREMPSVEVLREKLFLPEYFHVISIGTQECENSISKSIIYPGKDMWEKKCKEALGPNFQLIRGHSLQASHLAVFVHKSMINLISDVDSLAVATGLCDTLGNKGGIAIKMKIGNSKFCFLTAHLSAHQNQMDRRTEEFTRISKEVCRILGAQPTKGYTLATTATESSDDVGNEQMESGESFADDQQFTETSKTERCCSNQGLNCCICSKCRGGKCDLCSSERSLGSNPLLDEFDYVIWGGDFNFRIHGTRDIVDSLLNRNRCDLLYDNDQLNMLMQFDKAFEGFKEGPVTFRPTYKFDVNSDVYDTSSKRRIPAWTDRVLYNANPQLQLISYASAKDIRTSDHRPVYASFRCSIEISNEVVSREKRKQLLRSESKSEVCIIS